MVTEILKIILAASIPVTVIMALVERMVNKKGVGVRAIQFIAATTTMPIIAILALEDVLDGCAVAALVGALIGYLFSHINEFDRARSSRKGAQ